MPFQQNDFALLSNRPLLAVCHWNSKAGRKPTTAKRFIECATITTIMLMCVPERRGVVDVGVVAFGTSSGAEKIFRKKSLSSFERLTFYCSDDGR